MNPNNCDEVPLPDLPTHTENVRVFKYADRYPKKLDIKMMCTTKPAEFDFVLPGLIRGTVGIFTAQSGIGKSMITLQMAIQITCGRDSIRVGEMKQGKVVIFAGEDPALAIHHRLNDMTRIMRLSERELNMINDNLSIIPTIGHGVDVVVPMDYEFIEFHAHDTRLVVLDTLSRYHTGDENDAEHAKKTMANIERIAFSQNTSVMCPHHISKSSASSGGAGVSHQHSARGSSVWIDNARWGSFMSSGMTEEEAKHWGVNEADRKKYLKWNINKFNYCRPMLDVWLMKGEMGVLRPADFLPEQKRNASPAEYLKQSGGVTKKECSDGDF